MAKLPALMLYTGDWRKDPRLSFCPPAARGVWIDLICAMHDDDRSGQLIGTVDQLARVGRCSVSEMESALEFLRVTETATVTVRHGIITVINRRMRREWKERKSSADRQKRARDRKSNADVTEKLRAPLSSSSSIAYSYSKKEPVRLVKELPSDHSDNGAEPVRAGPSLVPDTDILKAFERWKGAGLTQAETNDFIFWAAGSTPRSLQLSAIENAIDSKAGYGTKKKAIRYVEAIIEAAVREGRAPGEVVTAKQVREKEVVEKMNRNDAARSRKADAKEDEEERVRKQSDDDEREARARIAALSKRKRTTIARRFVAEQGYKPMPPPKKLDPAEWSLMTIMRFLDWYDAENAVTKGKT